MAEITIKVKRELFRFSSEQDWINKGKSRYANCGVRQGHYIAIDAMGRVMHMGKCFNQRQSKVRIQWLFMSWKPTGKASPAVPCPSALSWKRQWWATCSTAPAT